MDPRELQQLMTLAITASTLAGALYGWYKIIWPKLKAAKQRFTDFTDSMERIPVALNSIKSIDGINHRLDLITKQVMPNGGSSLLDATKRIEAGMKDHAEKADAISKTLNLMAATMRAQSNTNPRMALFEADASGRLIDANKTYLRWTGLTIQELLGWGWINGVHPEDREKVRAEWLQAVSDVRTSAMRYRVVDDEGRVVVVDVTATPIPEGVVPCEKWVGVMYLVEGDHVR